MGTWARWRGPPAGLGGGNSWPPQEGGAPRGAGVQEVLFLPSHLRTDLRTKCSEASTSEGRSGDSPCADA